VIFRKLPGREFAFLVLLLVLDVVTLIPDALL
jgi:hypothetical protein